MASLEDATKHLDIGRDMLVQGNLVEALSHFDIAVGMYGENRIFRNFNFKSCMIKIIRLLNTLAGKM